MADNKVQLEATFEDKTEQGLASVKRGVGSMADSVARAGERTRNAFDGLGAGSGKAAEKVERDTRNLISSIERATAKTEAFGQSQSAMFESLARQRGVSTDVLRPYLDQLDAAVGKSEQVKAATQDLEASMRGMGGMLASMAAGVAASFSLGKFITETVNAQREQAQLAAVLKSTGEAAGWSGTQMGAMATNMARATSFSEGEITKAQTRLLSYTGILGAEFPRAMQAAADMSTRMGMDITSAAESVGRALDVPSQGLTALSRQGFRFTEDQKKLVEQLEETGRVAEAQDIILAALESSYGGAAAAARDTLGGALDELQKSINDLMTGGGGSVSALTQGVQVLSGAVQDANAMFVAMAEAADKDASSISGLQTIQNGLATAFETVAVLGLNVKYVLVGIGKEIGGLAAQAMALLSGDFGAARAIGTAMKDDAAKARAEVDRQSAAILGAREKLRAELAKPIAVGDPAARTHQPIRHDSDNKGSGANAGENEVARIRAMIKEEEAYTVALQQRGAAATALSSGEKLVIQIQEQLQTGIKGAARANKEAALAEAQKLAAVQASNRASEEQVKAIKAAQDASEKQVSDLYKQADALEQQASQLDAANAVWGKGKVAVEQYKLAQLQQQLAMADASDSFLPEYVKALQAAVAAQEHLTEATQNAEFKRLNQSIEEATRAAQEQLDTYQQELSLAGATSEERARIVAMRKVELDYAKRLAEIDRSSLREDQKAELRTQAAAERQVQAQAAAAKITADEWNKTADSINQSLTDALLRGFEDGKSFAKNFRDTLKNMFQTLVLRPVISFIVQPIGNAITGLVQGILGGGQGGLGGLLGNASNLWSGGSNIFNLFSGGWDSLLAGWGSKLGGLWGGITGQTAGNTALGISMGMTPAQAQAAALGASQAGGTTALTTSLPGLVAVATPLIVGMLAERNSRERVSGAAFATSDYRNDPRVNTTGTAYDPIRGTMPSHDDLVAAARDAGMSDADLARFGNGNDRALYQWVSSAGTKPNNDSGYNPGQNIDGLLSGKYASNFYQGQGYAHPEAMGWWNDKGYNLASNDPAATELSRTVATSIVAPFTDIARTLGQSADDLRVTVGYATRGDGNGVWAGMRVERGGQTVSDWTNMDDYHSVGEAVRGMYSQALNVLSTDFNLPEWAEKQATAARAEMDKLSGDNLAEQAAALYQSTTTEIAKTFAQIQQLIDIFPDFSAATQDSVHALAEAMGGMDQLTSSYQSYVSHFYSASEQQAFAWQQIETALNTVGVTMPHTREEFRALVESLDLNTEAGRNTFAVLMSVEGAFAQLTDAAGNAGEALGMTKDSVASMLKGILDEAKSADEARALGQQKAGEMIMDAVTNAMVNSVSDALMTAVIGPLVSQITAGASTAAAIDVAGASASASTLAAGGAAAAGAVAAGGSAAGNNMAAGGAAAATGLAAVVQQTVSVVNNIAQVFSMPEFREAFHDFGAAVGDLSASMFDARANIGAAVGYGSGGGFGGGGSGGGMGGGAGKELNDLADAIQRLGETAADEVKRLRGLITEESEFGQATLLAKFATATAAARAGDTKALEALPELSRSIEQITAATAITNIENVRMRAWLADSIEQTLKTLGVKVPAFAAGTNYVPSTMLAMVHEGERIVPAADNRALMAAIGGSDNGELVAEVRELRKQVSALQSRAEQTVRNTAGLPQLVEQFDNVTEGGNAMREVPA